MSVRSHPSPLYGIGTIPSLSVRRYLGETIPLRSAVLGPSLSTLRCRCDPIRLRSTVSGRFHPSPFGGTRTRPSLSGLRCWVHPSPLCGVGAIPSLSALRYRDDSIPLRSAVLGRDHPSPVCGAGAIPLRCRCDPIPLRSEVPVRSHPSPLYGIGTIQSLSVRRY